MFNKIKGVVIKAKRILVLGDYNAATGFSTVTTNIIRQVSNEFKSKVHFDIVAINWFGDDLPSGYEPSTDEADSIKEVQEKRGNDVVTIMKRIKKKNGDNITVYSAAHNDGRGDAFGRHGMLSMLGNFDYSLLFMIQDIPVLAPILKTVKEIQDHKKAKGKKQFKTMIYYPVDGGISRSWLKHFHLVDRIIAYTEFAREKTLGMRPELEERMRVILHGVDTKTFRPLSEDERIEFRESFFGENSRKDIICNINRNQSRKDIPSTIMAFETYLINRNSNAFLYLHMDPKDSLGYDLATLMEQTTLVFGEDYMFMPPDFINQRPDPGFMNCIYNACDAFLTTTTGEGFGLTILEAMATKLVVGAPLNTSIKELAGITGDSEGRLYPIVRLNPVVSVTDSIIREAVELDDTVDCLSAMINEDDMEQLYKKDIVEDAYKFAKSLDWEIIGKSWINEFKKLL